MTRPIGTARLSDEYTTILGRRPPTAVVGVRYWSVIERRRLGMTLREIADQEGVTPERVRQIEQAVFRKVRRWIRQRDIEAAREKGAVHPGWYE